VSTPRARISSNSEALILKDGLSGLGEKVESQKPSNGMGKVRARSSRLEVGAGLAIHSHSAIPTAPQW